MVWARCVLVGKRFEFREISMDVGLHFQPGFFVGVNPPQKLSTYEFREAIGLFHTLKWTVFVWVDVCKKSWLALAYGRQEGSYQE